MGGGGGKKRSASVGSEGEGSKSKAKRQTLLTMDGKVKEVLPVDLSIDEIDKLIEAHVGACVRASDQDGSDRMCMHALALDEIGPAIAAP